MRYDDLITEKINIDRHIEWNGIDDQTNDSIPFIMIWSLRSNLRRTLIHGDFHINCALRLMMEPICDSDASQFHNDEMIDRLRNTNTFVSHFYQLILSIPFLHPPLLSPPFNLLLSFRLRS